MADVIKKFNYSKTRGRGRGILGLTNFDPCRRPGEPSSSASGHDDKLGSASPSMSSQGQSATERQEPAQTGLAAEQAKESAGVCQKDTKSVRDSYDSLTPRPLPMYPERRQEVPGDEAI